MINQTMQILDLDYTNIAFDSNKQQLGLKIAAIVKTRVEECDRVVMAHRR